MSEKRRGARSKQTPRRGDAQTPRRPDAENSNPTQNFFTPHKLPPPSSSLSNFPILLPPFALTRRKMAIGFS
ncbi:MAG: hypothetical protein F6K58_07955 [Symploca sp. SIO2E9]|nr:hypothetical protein [Symploca sp. SIO2E9]